MKIGIIGAGYIGSTLAKLFVKQGHQVSLANSRGPDSLTEVAAQTGATAVTAAEAARSGEIVIVTIPQAAVTALDPDLFKDVSDEVVIVDTGNYYPARDGQIEAIEQGQIESVWVAEQLKRPVVKAFNNIIYLSLDQKGLPKGTAGRVALPVSADSSVAREKILKLVDEIGFDAYDAGTLSESWRQQPGTPAYVQDLDLEQLQTALAAAEQNKIAEYRKAANDAVKDYFAK